jgi:hypothetical protein
MLYVVGCVSSVGLVGEFDRVLPCDRPELFENSLRPVAKESARAGLALSLEMPDGGDLYFVVPPASCGQYVFNDLHPVGGRNGARPTAVFSCYVPFHSRAISLTMWLDGATVAKFIPLAAPTHATDIRLEGGSAHANRPGYRRFRLSWQCAPGQRARVEVKDHPGDDWEMLVLGTYSQSVVFDRPCGESPILCARVTTDNGFHAIRSTAALALPVESGSAGDAECPRSEACTLSESARVAENREK